MNRSRTRCRRRRVLASLGVLMAVWLLPSAAYAVVPNPPADASAPGAVAVDDGFAGDEPEFDDGAEDAWVAGDAGDESDLAAQPVAMARARAPAARVDRMMRGVRLWFMVRPLDPWGGGCHGRGGNDEDSIGWRACTSVKPRFRVMSLLDHAVWRRNVTAPRAREATIATTMTTRSRVRSLFHPG